MTIYPTYFKRPLDFILALVVLILTSPVMIVTWLLLIIQNKGRPFFFHKRPGYREQPFWLIKFKTMNDGTDADGNLLPDNKRITLVGKFVRKLSIDELPQLFNVLKGDMSMIGPRPLLFKYIPLYSQEQRRRHDVRPGITGWAQVNGRNSISWKRKFELDIEYVDNISFRFDWKIFWLTIWKIFRREGVNQSAERPMKPFDGKS